MFTKDNLQKLEKSLKNMNFNDKTNNELGQYDNPAIVCIDAVLSINRKYYNFVVPRIKHIQDIYPEINSLFKLKELLNNLSYEDVAKFLNYKHQQRVDILKRLVNKLIEICNIESQDLQQNELNKLKKWASQSSVYDFDKFKVSGIGIATFQYLRMLLGAKTVKPDVHIKKYVFTVIGETLNEKDTIKIFEDACKSCNLDVSVVDHTIWMQYANNVNENYFWNKNTWIKRS